MATYLNRISPTDSGEEANLDEALKVRLTDLANQAGQGVDEFVEAFLRRVAEADIRFDRGVPAFPPRPGAPVLTVEEVDRLAYGDEE